MTEPVELRPDSPDDQIPHRVALVVFATVDAVDQNDADHIVRMTLLRELLDSARRVNPGELPVVIRHAAPYHDVTWDVALGSIVQLQQALGAYHGYLRVEPTDRAFPHENSKDNL